MQVAAFRLLVRAWTECMNLWRNINGFLFGAYEQFQGNEAAYFLHDSAVSILQIECA